jgi:hypothetical protein
MAERLFGFYPRGAASDPEVFMTGVVQLLAAYPMTAVEAILSPLSGLPARHKFLPSISEIREALEDQVAVIRRRQQWEYTRKRYAEIEPLPQLPKPAEQPEPRPTLEDLRAKYGQNWGLSGQIKKPPPPRACSPASTFRPLSAFVGVAKGPAECTRAEMDELIATRRNATTNGDC